MKKTQLVFGLDVGIASCGWAAIDFEAKQIKGCGVRCFDKAEVPKTGASLALPRRQQRSQRRRLKRRWQRIQALKRLFRTHQIFSEHKFERDVVFTTPWTLRSEGLQRVLTSEELATAILHIAKRRGYRSLNGQPVEESDVPQSEEKKEEGKLLAGVRAFENEFSTVSDQFKTVGAYLAYELGVATKNSPLGDRFKKAVRNKSGEYRRTVLRDLLRNEIAILFEVQRSLGSQYATKDLEEKVLRIVFWQKPLQSMAAMVGNCRFERRAEQELPFTLRAPKCAPSAELFRLLQSINHLRIIDSAKGGERCLNISERAKVEKLAFEQAKVTYYQLRGRLSLKEEELFLDPVIRYESGEVSEREKTEKKRTFFEIKGYRALRSRIEAIDPDYWKKLDYEFRSDSETSQLDHIVWYLTVLKDPEQIKEKLLEISIPRAVAAGLLGIRFSTHGGLSIKACRKLSAYLRHDDKGERPLTYDKCVDRAYPQGDLSKAVGRGSRIPPFEPLTNPVVNRALSQARKILNAMIREYGMPDQVNIEVARDMSLSYKERKSFEKQLSERTHRWEQAETHFHELYRRASRNRTELGRYLMWQEQGRSCPYCGKDISPHASVDETATQVDHILPYSQWFDDSQANRVLVHSACNQEKGNYTPFEWKGNDDSGWWADFEARVAHYPLPKRRKLLRRSVKPAEQQEWKERNLNDTRYICREFMNHVANNLAFQGDGRHVFARKGGHTAHLRYLWGLTKNREENDLHHAQDAIVIACSTEVQIQVLEKFHKGDLIVSNMEQNLRNKRFPYPWENFRRDVEESVGEALISRAPSRRMYGEIHQETVRSERLLLNAEKVIVQRRRLDKEFFGKTKDEAKDPFLRNIFDAFNLDGTPGRNHRLYQAIRDRLKAYGNDPKNAFALPLHMPTNNGKQGPVIKRVTLMTNEKGGILVRGASAKRRGIASRGKMCRVDFFQLKGKLKVVPIYTSDVASGVLPNKAIRIEKPEELWEEMTEEAEFLFSLFPNDLVKITLHDGEIFFGYYRKLHRGDTRLYLLPVEKVLTKNNLEKYPLGKIAAVEKFYIDPLGKKYAVKQEKRRGLESRFGRKSRSTNYAKLAANS